MSISNSNIENTGQDFTSELTMYSFTVPRNGVYLIDVYLVNLSNEANTFVFKVYKTVKSADYLMDTYTVNKPNNADLRFLYAIDKEYPCRATDILKVTVEMTVGADVGAGYYCYITDQNADGYNAQDFRQTAVAPILETTINTVTNASQFILTGGSLTTGMYNGALIIVTNANGQDSDVAVRFVKDYGVGEAKEVIPNEALPFIPENGDSVQIIPFTAQCAVWQQGNTDISEKLQGGYPQVDVASIGGNSPISIIDITNAIKAIIGFTVGGVWTYQKLMKCLAAFFIGDWRDKSGSPGVQEILDPDDGTTVVMELTPSETTPYKSVTVLI